MADPLVEQVRAHRVPQWWRDAKFGIFVHWTPASVPGFAPVGGDIAPMIASREPTALGESPYTEWYENSMRFPGSSVSRFHAERYGDRPYEAFVADFEAGLAQWDPASWARHFRAAGAAYVVLVTKHHDGWCLWPTKVPNPHRPGWHATRDIVGELAAAVRAEGMRFGVYYSGGLDSRFNPHPVGRFSDLMLAQPRGEDYRAYAEAQVAELVERYQPSVLWGDISWPGTTKQLAKVLSAYYEVVPEGVVNDRFVPRSWLWNLATTRPMRWLIDLGAAASAKRDRGLVPPKPPLYDFRTPEYTSFDAVQEIAWECTRGMDHSFGYNRASRSEDFISREDLCWSLVDCVAKGGNLLLNVGPRGEDARIPDEQLTRLGWLAELFAAGGELLRGSTPAEVPAATDADAELRYTWRGEDLVVAIRSAPGAEGRRDLLLTSVVAAGSAVDGQGRGLELEQRDDGLHVRLFEPTARDRPQVLLLSDAQQAGRPAASR